MDPPTALSCTESASKLSELAAHLSSNDGDDAWRSVEAAAHHLADSLKRRSPGQLIRS